MVLLTAIHFNKGGGDDNIRHGTSTWKIEIVRRCDGHKFVVLPKRWIVERTIGWLANSSGIAASLPPSSAWS